MRDAYRRALAARIHEHKQGLPHTKGPDFRALWDKLSISELKALCRHYGLPDRVEIDFSCYRGKG